VGPLQRNHRREAGSAYESPTQLFRSCPPPTPTMSTIKLTCLFDGHNERHTFSVRFPLELTIGHLLDCYENDHDTSDCKCQAAPTGVVWVANISPQLLSKVQFDPAATTAARRCERDDLISSIVDDIEAFATVHLIVERTTRPRMLHLHTPMIRLPDTLRA